MIISIYNVVYYSIMDRRGRTNAFSYAEVIA